jgi:hypothetical protein
MKFMQSAGYKTIKMLTAAVVGSATVYAFTWGWGRNQVLTPEVVGRMVQFGDTEKEVRRTLSEYGLPRTQPTGHGGQYFLVVANRGFGSIVIPQYRIVLIFDSDKAVISAEATINYRFDEAFVSVPISKPRNQSEPSRQKQL